MLRLIPNVAVKRAPQSHRLRQTSDSFKTLVRAYGSYYFVSVVTPNYNYFMHVALINSYRHLQNPSSFW